MRFAAIAIAALMAGNASAGLTCEGPRIKVAEQGGRVLMTLNTQENETTTFPVECLNFYRLPDHSQAQNMLLCHASEFYSADGFILQPNAVLMVLVLDGAFTTMNLVFEATCTGFNDE